MKSIFRVGWQASDKVYSIGENLGMKESLALEIVQYVWNVQ